jgi:hypothetical protein
MLKNMEDIKLYYEENEIVNVEKGEGELRKVTLRNQSGETVVDIMQWELDACTTKEPSDASTGRNERAIILVDKIYDMFKEMNVNINEMGYVFQKFLAKTQGIEQKAVLNCFGKNEVNDVRIMDWENKL